MTRQMGGWGLRFAQADRLTCQSKSGELRENIVVILHINFLK